MYLERGILPIKYEIEMRQLLFLKCILDKKHVDPCLLTYNEIFKFENEPNWANNVFCLRRDYNVPLNDDNIKKMLVNHWKYFVKSANLRRLSLSFRLNSLLIGSPATFHIPL